MRDTSPTQGGYEYTPLPQCVSPAGLDNLGAWRPGLSGTLRIWIASAAVSSRGSTRSITRPRACTRSPTSSIGIFPGGSVRLQTAKQTVQRPRCEDAAEPDRAHREVCGHVPGPSDRPLSAGELRRGVGRLVQGPPRMRAASEAGRHGEPLTINARVDSSSSARSRVVAAAWRGCTATPAPRVRNVCLGGVPADRR